MNYTMQMFFCNLVGVFISGLVWTHRHACTVPVGRVSERERVTGGKRKKAGEGYRVTD